MRFVPHCESGDRRVGDTHVDPRCLGWALRIFECDEILFDEDSITGISILVVHQEAFMRPCGKQGSGLSVYQVGNRVGRISHLLQWPTNRIFQCRHPAVVACCANRLNRDFMQDRSSVSPDLVHHHILPHRILAYYCLGKWTLVRALALDICPRGGEMLQPLRIDVFPRQRQSTTEDARSHTPDRSARALSRL